MTPCSFLPGQRHWILFLQEKVNIRVFQHTLKLDFHDRTRSYPAVMSRLLVCFTVSVNDFTNDVTMRSFLLSLRCSLNPAQPRSKLYNSCSLIHTERELVYFCFIASARKLYKTYSDPHLTQCARCAFSFERRLLVKQWESIKTCQ